MIAPVRAAASWLSLREGADGQARSTELVREVAAVLPHEDLLVVHDLGSGTGSMGRWLAPLLMARSAPQVTPPLTPLLTQPFARQHWVLHDRDADLLAEAAVRPVVRGGEPVSVRIRCGDVTWLSADDLSGAGLITASALLDMLTAAELERLAGVCVAADCPALITLSVTGRVELEPADPMDRAIRDAFNAHQRRNVGRARLLGPDAADAAVEAFRRQGVQVLVRPSPWRLGAADAALTTHWLQGWVGAACAQDPDLIDDAAPYLLRRIASAVDGGLRVTVRHDDLLAMPR